MKLSWFLLTPGDNRSSNSTVYSAGVPSLQNFKTAK
uniref:Uncharacterized protein n=1 Tax=Nelumbo nucifera TaxID=4432 RepID=A0A822YGG9_NELNU|nr:TPA_asm: hypothetical protein HUJ06_031524 [Nelumbo nucifera]